MFKWIGEIAKGVSEGIVSPLFSWLNKKEDVQLEKYKVDGKVNSDLINANIQLGIAKIELLKNKWLIALQVLFGVPLAVYYGKILIVDKVLGMGRTDALTGDIQTYSLWIVGFLFAHSAIDRWVRK